MSGGLDKNEWLGFVESEIKDFSKKYNMLYRLSERKIYASFEIGCFHALLNFYNKNAIDVVPKNLKDNCFRYLTTPSGNPNNFSYVHVRLANNKECEIRQQVRVLSHIDDDICFTPDIVVMRSSEDSVVECKSIKEYSNGKKGFFYVRSENVFAAHECKSMVPFPELMVSFVGTLVVAHKWLENATDRSLLGDEGEHLAPTLFVGGAASGLHNRLINALQKSMPMNIVDSLYLGRWNLHNRTRKINRFTCP